MSIAAAFMVPHPPFIVHEVGKGEEKSVQKTIDAYKRVADEIAQLKPDTIIISSPHTVMYHDYFHISPGLGAKGDFARFRAGEVRFDETYDAELVKMIEQLAKKSGIPAGTLGEEDRELDHGTMVPLYFIRKKYTGGKIIRIGLSGLPLETHYELGIVIAHAVDSLDRNAVYIASGDLSHKLQYHGPYGFAKEGPEYDKRVMDVCSRGAFSELLEFDEDLCSKAAECGHRSFVIMAGALDGIEIKAQQLSHEDITGVGYGICTFYPTGKINEDPYVKLARMTIEEYARTGKTLKVPEDIPDELIKTKAGCFVSIHKNGDLRGCIGTIAPTKGSVAKEIISNAISASTRDPRFPPIDEQELSELEINVDVLGEPEQIDSLDMLDVKRYGVIVTSGFKRGLLLPDLEGVDTVEDQVDIAMQKGGISYDDKITLHRFEVIRHK